ncbi:LOW QUALITY PROTEIN: hypothetical protein MAR_026740 [Mya arenaria]|uniref:Uncharacterized protein n=1 Tax=Mya arenaria TaxID=6604 RepID=A0ABY7ERE0_MYAAR|nr:LOW QUALITY PROTEIN: hypothetical protein MAR_026740 [Mya arenaria]
MELADIVKKPNRERLLLLMKCLMLILKDHNNKSKYALELLSQQEANEVVYGLFVNTGNSIIPADLQMEHLVRLTKGHLRSMCSNTILWPKEAMPSLEWTNHVSCINRSQKHKRLSSIEDEKKILKDLRVTRPFLKTAGRKANSLKRRPKHPEAKLNMDDFIKWIEKNKLKFYYEL